MNFSQKIFVNDNPLILTTSSAGYIHQNSIAKHYATFSGATVSNFIKAIDLLEGVQNTGAMIEDQSEDALMKQLHTLYHPIDAAGGVVLNERGELLMIYRRGKWDLPKGKLDEGEDIELCALREVSEETGLLTLTIESKVCDTFHIYAQGDEHLVKRTAWYQMNGTLADKLIPQKEEKILEARWVNTSEISSLAAKSYEAVREVIRAAGVDF